MTEKKEFSKIEAVRLVGMGYPVRAIKWDPDKFIYFDTDRELIVRQDGLEYYFNADRGKDVRYELYTPEKKPVKYYRPLVVMKKEGGRPFTYHYPEYSKDKLYFDQSDIIVLKWDEIEVMESTFVPKFEDPDLNEIL